MKAEARDECDNGDYTLREDELDPGTEYHIIGLVNQHYNKGCGSRGYNPYPLVTKEHDFYAKTMEEMFDVEYIEDAFGRR